MSEETNSEPVEPASGTDEPTRPETSVEQPTMEAPGASAAVPPARAGVFVPKWLLLAFGGLALLGIGFAAGHVVGSDSDHRERRGGFSYNSDDRRSSGDNTSPIAPTPRNGNRRNGGGQGATPSAAVYLGVVVQDSSDLAGAKLVRVVASSPAADAGLQTGDVVTALNSTSTTSAAQLTAAVRTYHAGDQVSVTYTRAGSSKSVNVRLATRPDVPPLTQQ